MTEHPPRAVWAKAAGRVKSCAKRPAFRSGSPDRGARTAGVAKFRDLGRTNVSRETVPPDGPLRSDRKAAHASVASGNGFDSQSGEQR